MKTVYAVLTGDLVGSSAAGAARREEYRLHVHKTFHALSEALPRLPAPNELIGWQMFRGDSFQAVLRRPSGSVRAAVLIRAGVRSFAAPPKRALVDARVAVGLGGVDLLPSEAVGEGDGPAFRLSGKLLDAMGKRRLALAAEDRLRPDAFAGALPLIDGVVSRWTAREAGVAFLALQGLSGQAVAASLGLAPTLVSRLVRRALVEELDLVCRDIDRLITDTDVPI
jgi:hypothetical protein